MMEANLFDIPTYQGPFPEAPSKELMKMLPYSVAKENSILPIDLNSSSLTLCTSRPENIDIFQSLAWAYKRKIITYYLPENEILKQQKRAYQKKLSKKDKSSSKEDSKVYQSHYDLISDDGNDPIIKALNLLISDAIEQGASDIHLEPQDSGLSIRFRVDGILIKQAYNLEKEGLKVTSRIKVLAKLDVAQSRLPQDGRIHFSLGDRIIDTRVSTIPTLYGERVVLRLLDKKTLLLSLKDLKLDDKDLKQMEKIIHAQEGMIIVTGPTGSGKTTTLYSFLSDILSSDRNIMTIEDPIEYHLKGISQINVNSSIQLTFAKGLRHILRQDPDVIMLGEIRDKETAQIAFQSSLTGHLVLSTLHANNAPATVIRLVDMGVDPVLINSTLLASISQRLARKICPHCKRKSKKTILDFPSYEGSGCSKCSYTGYLGRTPIFEIMYLDEEIRSAISQKASSNELFELAKSKGMIPLKESCQDLAKRGITTAEEVLRIT